MLKKNSAFRWHNGKLTIVKLPDNISSIRLIGLDEQKDLFYKNINYLIKNGNALNVLLWGEKGAGKSTLLRSIAIDFAADNLKVIEFCSDDFYEIYDIYQTIRENPDYSFVLYFDDVSFNENDAKYRNFKSIVEGGLEEKPPRTIFIATSNRRHLIAEKTADTSDVYDRDDQNESTSLFARFGLTIGFYPMHQELYLKIVKHYLNQEGLGDLVDWEKEAGIYAIDKGGRSGRVAQQFAVYKKILKNT